MKRGQVIKKLKNQAKIEGLDFEIIELTRHTAIRIGDTSRTLGRHTEIPDHTARKFFAQFTDELGKDWWRK